MKITVKGWQDFLDSLATSGGNIVTLFWCSAFAAILWIWTYSHGDNGQLVMATFGVFTGFTGALLQAQKGNSSRQQMQDRKESAMPAATVETGKVETLNVQTDGKAAVPVIPGITRPGDPIV